MPRRMLCVEDVPARSSRIAAASTFCETRRSPPPGSSEAHKKEGKHGRTVRYSRHTPVAARTERINPCRDLPPYSGCGAVPERSASDELNTSRAEVGPLSESQESVCRG